MTVAPETAEVRSGGIQVIARAAEILRLLQSHPGGLNQAEICERVGMARSTVSRILNALEDEGLVASRRAPGALPIGPGDRADGQHGAPRGGHRHAPVPDRPVAQPQRNGGPVDSGRRPRRLHRPGRRAAPPAGGERGGETFPLYCSANGKALLAALPPDQLAQAMPKRLVQLTPNTITDQAALRDELDRVRADGVAYDREEQTEGICAVGAVLHGVSDVLVAVSVPVPAQRFYGREAELAQVLRAWVAKVDTRSRVRY